MKRSSSLFLTWTLGLAATAALASAALAQDAGKATGTKTTTQPPPGVITIESVPAQKVLSRQIQGGYDKHQEVFNDLKTTVTKLSTAAVRKPPGVKVAVAADCVGLYALDPDSTAPASLTWTAALYVPDTFQLPAGTKAPTLSVPASDYRVETLPAVQAAVMYSTIGQAPTDGLKFFGWMANNGYAQVAPTRMVYFTDPQFDLLHATPEQVRDSKTKIVVPVQRRTSAAALKQGKTQE